MTSRTSVFATRVHWHASRSCAALAGDLECGGNLRRTSSRVLGTRGCTVPRVISTAHVPHVPNPRQLMSLELPLWGDTPPLRSAVRSVVPAAASTVVLRKNTVHGDSARKCALPLEAWSWLLKSRRWRPFLGSPRKAVDRGTASRPDDNDERARTMKYLFIAFIRANIGRVIPNSSIGSINLSSSATQMTFEIKGISLGLQHLYCAIEATLLVWPRGSCRLSTRSVDIYTHAR